MTTGFTFYDEAIILLFAIALIFWIGLVFYSCFISQSVLKNLNESDSSKYLINIQPKVMWYMRWTALISFIVSIYILSLISDIPSAYNIGTSLASLILTFMFLNTWLIIWRKQKRIISRTTDAKKCEERYDHAIRVNAIFAFPLIGLIIYSAQAKEVVNPLLELDGSLGPGWSSFILWGSILIILLIQTNLVFGKKPGWLNKSKNVLVFGIVLILLIGLLLRNS